MFNNISTTDATALNIDHIVINVDDNLDAFIRQFEERTGVKPHIYTKLQNKQNAIVHLGGQTYLEIIGLTSGAVGTAEPSKGISGSGVSGWAVNTHNIEDTQTSLERMGFSTTDVATHHRTRTDNSNAQWSSFGVRPKIKGRPFFIQWSKETQHPSLVAPKGCTLKALNIATPHFLAMGALKKSFRLDSINTRLWYTDKLTLTLDCPKGEVSF